MQSLWMKYKKCCLVSLTEHSGQKFKNQGVFLEIMLKIQFFEITF